MRLTHLYQLGAFEIWFWAQLIFWNSIKLYFLQERKNGHQTGKPGRLSNDNNSPEEAKSPTPPPDLDVSYRRIIPFGPFDKSFSEDPNEYFYFGEQVPPMTLSRSLRKGDILEVAVLSITNPGKKCLCSLDPNIIFPRRHKTTNITIAVLESVCS